MKTNKSLNKAIIIGMSADIGLALCEDWLLKNWAVSGTYRTSAEAVRRLEPEMTALVQCDLASKISVEAACTELKTSACNWDTLVFAPGLQEPIGPFSGCDFNAWEESIDVNFTNQLRILHALMPLKNGPTEKSPTVLFFAGGGVNSAPINYSAYTVAKIALIKMVELLAAEIRDVKFVIVGPGWVKTKIHDSILNAGERAGASYERTRQAFKEDAFTPMKKVIECCNALIDGPRESLTGRNFSVVFDRWDDPQLSALLAEDADMYKLRRHGNER